MEYLHVLSRPKVIDREHDTVWTEAYIDSTVSGHFYFTKGTALQIYATLIKECYFDLQFNRLNSSVGQKALLVTHL